MPGQGSLVATGAMNSHNRFLPTLLTLVRLEVVPGTRRAVMILTTIGAAADQLEHDAPDMIDIDLDAPASDMIHQLGNCRSAVMRSLFGGVS